MTYMNYAMKNQFLENCVNMLADAGKHIRNHHISSNAGSDYYSIKRSDFSLNDSTMLENLPYHIENLDKLHKPNYKNDANHHKVKKYVLEKSNLIEEFAKDMMRVSKPITQYFHKLNVDPATLYTCIQEVMYNNADLEKVTRIFYQTPAHKGRDLTVEYTKPRTNAHHPF